jgi:poly-gamma-glutamate capsule biosynthesis protein CapA/YwtB (metallophosphatase superfamily)
MSGGGASLPHSVPERAVTLWLCGDVMTGRGVDQILPHPCDPELYEPHVRNAERYVELAEKASGAISRPVDLAYPWGAALAELDAVRPDARIINLETAIIRHGAEPWPRKGIHYRTSPENAGLLRRAAIDCSALANNHVLDWGYAGLVETLRSLDALGVRHAGAGANRTQAEAPAEVRLTGGGRVLIFALALKSSGVPAAWAAGDASPGIALVADLSRATLKGVVERVRAHKRAGDLAVVSIHWGANWGWGVPPAHREFARGLVETGAVEIVHGHSSHHVLGIEVHAGRLILYGSGDFLNDYEGIGGYQRFRGDLGLMYFATVNLATGALVRLRMTPTRIERLQVARAWGEDTHWLRETLNREGADLGTSVDPTPRGRLELRWNSASRSSGSQTSGPSAL